MTSSVANQVMPQPLPSYTFVETIYEGARTRVYRAVETATQQPVVIKVLTHEYPSFAELVQFRNQYMVAKNLPITGIVRPLSLEPYGNGYALVMETFEGVDLEQYIHQCALSLAEVLSIAIQLTDILHTLHQHRVIHKDIKPANILIHPDSKQVKLIDFSIASLLPQETQAIQSPKSLEGTLAYMAPEQTGRMNRGINYRTDFYGLGGTLYQLLTGQLPFTSDDPLELIHCHMAQAPAAVEQVNPAIPAMVSAIVAKLMAKNAEDRYQSALGLKHDLERCLMQWQQQGNIAPFDLGQRDVSDRFVIPEKLYGREAEVQQLLDAFDRVADGASELMLVAGFSGIGKTAVINEVHKPITRQRGYFIKGKFDQFNRNVPFSAFVQVFRDLMGQLLSESDAELATWKAQILKALGENAQVIIDLIPELEAILGPQPAAPELSGMAAQNRFHLLFQQFIQVFTTAEHPLVIFVDDLQWADSTSLNLMQVLMGETQVEHLLMLGAYRDNEVFPAHPLMVTLAAIARAGVSLETITLQPLTFDSLHHLIADTLHAPALTAQPLTKLVMKKTQGNPFFAAQFLTVLHQDGLFEFDPVVGQWRYEIAAIKDQALTEDVVEFIALQLQKLPPETQEGLKIAACIGAQFNLSTLAIASETTAINASSHLWAALQTGFLVPTSRSYTAFQGHEDKLLVGEGGHPTVDPSYRFLHDRVQQAAYALIPEAQKAQLHWHIGNLLWQAASDEPEDSIFDLVNQLNLGRSSISEPRQSYQLAQFNLQAAKKSKLAAAHRATQTYCQTGIALLSEVKAWQVNYDLMYALHYHGAEAAYLSGDFDQAEQLYRTTLAQAKSALDQAAIYRIQMTQYQFQGRNGEAIAIQRKSARLLGLEIPIEPDQVQGNLNAEIETVTKFLQQHTVESILALPQMTAAPTEEILRILQILFYAAWLDGQPTLALLALAKMTTLSLQHGNSEMSPFGYAGYGLIANAMRQDAAQACQFGYMAVQLCEQFDNADVRGMTNFLFAADVHSWKQPLQEADRYYENAYKSSMDAGNWLTVSFVMMLSGSDRLTYGKNLDELHQIAQSHADFLQRIKSLENLDALKAGVLQPVRQLLGLTTSPTSFDDDGFSEDAYLQKYQNTPYHLAWFYSVKIRHAYLFGQIESYAALIPKANIIGNTIPTHAKLPSTLFYVALMHLALLGKTSDAEQQATHWQAIQQLEERLNRWQKDCPENIAHKYSLLQAEKARLQGDRATAIDRYEQSIDQAQAQGYGYEAALAHELAAQFYLDWGKEKVAAGYLQDAYYGYAHWGAKAKLADLEARYPQLLQPIRQTPASSAGVLDTLMTLATPTVSAQAQSCQSSSRSDRNQAIDFATVLKASQTLTSTLKLKDLLCQLTQIILQNSGADRCALILPDATDQWQVRAIATLAETRLCTEPINNHPALPIKLTQYVKNTQETVIINDLETPLPVVDDYLKHHQPQSVLGLPLLNQGRCIGVICLENRLTRGVFTGDRLLVLNFLSTQAAISLENARLYTQAQEDQRRLASLMSNLPGMAYLAGNDEHWTMHFASEGCLELTGYTSDELIHNRATDFGSMIHADDAEAVGREVEAAIAAQRPFRVVYRIRTKQGKEKWLWEQGQAILDDSGQPTLLEGLIIDISDRKQAEIALQKNEAHLRALVSALPDLIMRVSREGIYLEFSASSDFRVMGHLPDWLGTHVTTNLPSELAQQRLTAIHQALATRRVQTYEQRLDLEGAPQYEEVRVVPYAEDEVLLLVRDISDRKAAEEASQEFQRRLKFLIDQMPIGMVEWNLNFEIIGWNAAAEEIFGYSAAEMLGQQGMQFIPASVRPRVAEIRAKLLEQRGGTFSLNENLRKDGTTIICEWINTVLHDADNNLIGVVSMVQDVSERESDKAAIAQKSQALTQTLEELQQTQLKMVQSEKMAVLGNLVAGVAHEVNNPIGFLNGSIQNAEDYVQEIFEHLKTYQELQPPNSEVQDSAEAIDLDFLLEDLPQLLHSMKGATHRIKNISTSLRTFSRADMEHKVRAKLHEGLDSTLLILKYRLKANDQRPAIEIVHSYGELPEIECFPGQLNQVFMNILANAIDMFDEMAQQTTFKDLKNMPQQITIQTAMLTGKHAVEVRISDNGAGMPDDVQSRIFDSSFTTKGVGRGTGLGLAIARQIVVDSHGGSLDVTSKVGQGTEFCIQLPL
ncbi:MAG: AAA family ATPase [Cyanobacteria bacterium J06638_28]